MKNAYRGKPMESPAITLLDLEVEGMSCNHCIARVTKALGSVAGVEVVSVVCGRARVMAPASVDARDLRSAVDEAGYALRIIDSATTAQGPSGIPVG